jgi:hypothetical protein
MPKLVWTKSTLGKGDPSKQSDQTLREVKLISDTKPGTMTAHIFGGTTFSMRTLGITTLSITTLSLKMLSIMTLSITTLSIMTLSITTIGEAGFHRSGFSPKRVFTETFGGGDSPNVP